jgi:GT2 family glycosyltransferase
MANLKFSIIIPTFQHCTDLLQPAIESIIQYTDLSHGEVIVVANGCTDGTEEYVKSLGESFKLLSFKEPLGYTKATNEGIKVAEGEYLILFNNDNVLLGQSKNLWLQHLIEPFLNDPKIGVTGPLQLHDDYADADVIIGFCLCVPKKVLNEVMSSTNGLLDETFSPGGGEDIDLCCKMRQKGYTVRQVPREGKLGFSHTNTGEYPIWHKNNQTFKDIPEYTNWIIKRNGVINMKRYNKHIKLNLGAGGIEHPGYLSVDLYDKRAVIKADITTLDLDDNSVDELLAIHVFEHLNVYHSIAILKNWCRILKPDGKLIMEMPDINRLCERFVSANTKERYGILNAIYGSVNTTNEGDPSNITAPHLWGWYDEILRDHLVGAGFTNITFGPEQYPHPESNLRVEAQKPSVTDTGHVEVIKAEIIKAEAEVIKNRSMIGLWPLDKVENKFPFGDTTSYKKAMEFLDGCETVEDWGCATAFAAQFLKSGKYIGIDGSNNKFCDTVADLRNYKSKSDGILIRHVLEHNFDWDSILKNAIESFQKKLVLILFTPFAESTKQIATNWSDIPDLSFRELDLIEHFKYFNFTKELLHTNTQYGQECIFYITKTQPLG